MCERGIKKDFFERIYIDINAIIYKTQTSCLRHYSTLLRWLHSSCALYIHDTHIIYAL